MEDLKEITLKVKVDTYKALQNYLNNELKITKADVEDMVSKFVEAIIERQLLTNGTLNNKIDKAVKEAIGRLSTVYSFNLEKRVDMAIEQVLGQTILRLVKEQLQDFKVSVSKE